LLRRNNQRMCAGLVAAAGIGHDDSSQLGVLWRGRRQVKTQHVWQDERVRQPVRHVEDAADRIGQRVYRRDGRVRERLAGQAGAEQHGLARLEAGAVFAGRDQVARQ
jgi:hypothetical protein